MARRSKEDRRILRGLTREDWAVVDVFAIDDPNYRPPSLCSESMLDELIARKREPKRSITEILDESNWSPRMKETMEALRAAAEVSDSEMSAC